jgi:hypothetical protein
MPSYGDSSAGRRVVEGSLRGQRARRRTRRGPKAGMASVAAGCVGARGARETGRARSRGRPVRVRTCPRRGRRPRVGQAPTEGARCGACAPGPDRAALDVDLRETEHHSQERFGLGRLWVVDYLAEVQKIDSVRPEVQAALGRRHSSSGSSPIGPPRPAGVARHWRNGRYEPLCTNPPRRHLPAVSNMVAHSFRTRRNPAGPRGLSLNLNIELGHAPSSQSGGTGIRVAHAGRGRLPHHFRFVDPSDAALKTRRRAFSDREETFSIAFDLGNLVRSNLSLRLLDVDAPEPRRIEPEDLGFHVVR